jgi:hypothetical protein
MSYDSNGNEFGVSGGSDRLPQIDNLQDANSAVNPLGELMRAMVLRVIDDVRSGGELKADAMEYMESDDEEYIFGFRNVASYLGVDYRILREAIVNPTHRISTRRRAA